MINWMKIAFVCILLGLFGLAFSAVGYIQKADKAETQSKLEAYNKEHNTDYKDADDVTESVTYTGDFTIKTIHEDKSIADYIFGDDPTHREITYTTDKGSKVTTEYDGDLDDGTYKDGTVTITTSLIYSSKELTAEE